MGESVCESVARREYIKYALRLRGISLADLGRELKVSRPTLSQVCAGTRSSERLRAAIAERLSSTPEQLWGC